MRRGGVACRQRRGRGGPARFCHLVAVAGGVTLLSFGPWLYLGQLRTVRGALTPAFHAATCPYMPPDRDLCACLVQLDSNCMSSSWSAELDAQRQRQRLWTLAV